VSIEAEPVSEQATLQPARGSRRLRSAIPLAILLVLLAELAIRAAEPKLRDPLLWPGWEAQNKVVAMDRLGGHRGASVAFVGSSMVNAGLSAEVATRELRGKRPAFNAALNGSDLRATSIWTREVVVPRLHPDVVVVGFNSGELNDHWNEPDSLYARLIESPYGKRAAGEGGVLTQIDTWLMDRSSLIRHRTVLRNPMDAFSKERAQRRQGVDRLGRLIALENFQQRPYTAGLSNQLGAWDEVFRNYRPGGEQFRAMDRLVRDLTRQGIKVVLVRMPVTMDVVPLHPTGVADREAFGRALMSFVSSHPVTFLDGEAAIGHETSQFVDPLHLNVAGERTLTTYVVGELQKRNQI
jgi:hypothetical protein